MMSISGAIQRWRFSLAMAALGVVIGALAFRVTRPLLPLKTPGLYWSDLKAQNQKEERAKAESAPRNNWKTKVKPEIPAEGIDSGFLFAHGHFIPRPYKVQVREDYLVTVNGVAVNCVPPNPPPLPKPEDPGEFAWPKGCRSEATGVSEYLDKKMIYLKAIHGTEKAVAMLIDIARRQPGVASVCSVNSYTFGIEFLDGYAIAYSETPPGLIVQPTEEERAQQLEHKREIVESLLEGGGLMIFSSGTGTFTGACETIMTPSPRTAKARIRSIIEILTSPGTEQERLARLTTILSNREDVSHEILVNLEITHALRKMCE